MTFAPRFDCHAHVYERIHAAGQPRYLPKALAPREVWRKHLQTHGLEGGVIVQTSFFGHDISELLNALRALGARKFRGVASVPMDAGGEQLQALKAEGICGIRWNLVRGAARPDLTLQPVQDFLKRLNRVGLHLEIHLEGALLGPYLRGLAHHVDHIVVDHFGLPSAPLPSDEPWIAALRDLASSSDIWVKFSAPYRNPVDIQPYAEAILEIIGMERVVWGSDWPWTQHENKHDYIDTIEWGKAWFSCADSTEIDKASIQLYGFEHH